ncbi:uncharacterized protein LOC134816688 [Bolinopsis microptera]|uniref:uncharacterized protein LOC134816688 n=1 Tax=Bolinopsis microptera TaxID=2820187 RepID=UPI00307AF482
MSNSLIHTDDNTEQDRKLAAAEKKNLGNIAFKEQRLDEALTLYDEAIAMDPTQMSFYNNKGAVYIHKKKFLLAKNVCSNALTIGQKYGGSSADKARSLARIGKACLQMGDIYNATWKYDEALTTLETDYEAVMVDKVTPQPVPSTKNVDEIQKQAAVKKKELGNKAYQKGQYDEALVLYNEAIELDHTQISFYNNKGAVYIQRKDFSSAKNVCLEAVRIGDQYFACAKEKMRALSRIGKAERELGSIYNSMWNYEKALSTYSDKVLANELDKVYSEVKEALLRTDDLSKEKIAATGEMISRVYIDRKMTYTTKYENPVMLPQAPQQTFVDAFTEEDTSGKSLKHKDQQVQYTAEVDLYNTLENLISKRKIIVLHNFKFTKEQAELYASSGGTSGEHDFVVIVRGYAVILFEVKSPMKINKKVFKRNLDDSRKQLERVQTLVHNICSSWGVSLGKENVFKYTVFPRISKVDVAEFLPENAINNIIFQENIQNFSRWWLNNIMYQLVDRSMASQNKTREMQIIEASLVGIWCIDQNNKCVIDICSLGYCINQIDKALKSADISQNIKNPVTKSVKVSPDIFKNYLGINCLTDEQKEIFHDDVTSQFITGAAGTGKTLLLFGKAIQLFLKPSNDEQAKKKMLFITGTMDLAHIEDLFQKVGMKCITSHKVNGGHTSRFGKLFLVKNESFFHALFDSDAIFDIFILHQTALKDESLWPKCFHQSLTKNDILTNLAQYLNYHTFVDDIHNYWDKFLVTYINSSYELGYSNTFALKLVSNLRSDMKNRIEGQKSSAYFWIAFDMNQMAFSIDESHGGSVTIFIQKLRLLLRYNRDLDVALKKELGQNQGIFRCISRNIRNSVSISCSIENARMHYSNTITNFQLPGKEFSKYAKKYKVFKNPGHHIQGPKPRFILVGNSKEQEKIVHRVIRDELNKLLELGDNLCPNDVAIIMDSCTPTVMINAMERFEMPTHAMMNFSEKLFNEVTIRRVSDRDSVQASEWKAVILVAELHEFLGPNHALYNNLRSAVDGDATLLESILTLYTSTLYIPLSRARVYLIVIGKLGGFERSVLANEVDLLVEYNKKGNHPEFLKYYRKGMSAREKEMGSMSKDKRMMFINEEYEYLKRSDFVYREVDMDRTLETKPKSGGIWFNPMSR